MSFMKFSVLAALCIFVVIIGSTWASFKERDKVLYKDLGTLYFSPGEKTRARRTFSVPQLVCLKGCHYPQPKQVQCINTGWDGSSNLWKCKSDLDSNYALDSPEVICEGYSSPDDAYVTVGSCSLEYSVKPRNNKSGGGLELYSILFFMFCIFLVFVLYACYESTLEQRRQNSFTNDDDSDDGPDDGRGPQMGWNIPGMNGKRRRRRGRGNESGSTSGGDSCGTGNQQNQRYGAGGGGFWTGLATGGVLGYMMGGNRNQNAGGFGYDSMSAPSSSSGFGRSYSSRRSSGPGLFRAEDEESSNSENISTARYRQR